MRRKEQQKYRKPSQKQQQIDQQILLLHQAMAEKLLANPHLVEQVLATLNQRYNQGTMRYGAFITWQSLLECIDDRSRFLSAVLDNSPTMQKYRRKTPFVGILTEEERQHVLNSM